MSPWCNIEGFYFDPQTEPDEFSFNYKKDIEQHLREEGYTVIPIEADSREEYYSVLNKASKMVNDNTSIESVPRNKVEIIVDEESEDPQDEVKEEEPEDDDEG